jgi:CDP-6-deoxy-D-xylo-4-hexulose-3-dehydrase
LTPVFVDINLSDLSFDYGKLEAAITTQTRIILVTHLIGLPADMGRVMEIAAKHKLIVLEDCCESHGATFGDKKAGNFGLASTFSFYWGHHMTTVEGGMICTANDELNDLFILKRSHGLARELPPAKHRKYKDLHPGIDFNFLFLTHGYNVRNTELHAVLGIEQLKHLDRYVATRNRNYQDFLRLTHFMENRLYTFTHPGISSFCLPFVFKKSGDKKKLELALREHAVESRPVISGNLLMQPCYRCYGKHTDFTNAQILHENGLYIGNNQFVNKERLGILEEILRTLF